MDRQIVYPGQIPLETDLLNSQKNAMIGLGKLAAALLGTSTYVNGLSVGPNSPAALNVIVQPGEIYSLANIDGTAYSSIAADTTHSILKQGIMLDAVTLSTPAPGTAGQSINYLIQAQFSEVDSNAVVLPYYNASNPSQAYGGPNGTGTTNNTVRKGTVVVSAKAGVAATTGSQTTPAPDAGYVGLYVVTVANGQSTVVSGNISQYSGAPIYGQAALLNALNAFTQTPTFPTAAQFDNSNKGASTAFVKAAGVQFAGQITVSSATVLTAATSAGKYHYLMGVGGYTVTLPAANSVPAGTVLQFFCVSSPAITVARAGADGIQVNSGAQLTGISMLAGDNLTLVSDGGAAWMAIAGSANLPNSALFGASLLSNGYQKLPSGLIIQWGAVSASVAGAAVTFPITSPNATLFFGALEANGSSTLTNLSTGGVSQTGGTVYAGSGPVSVFWLALSK